MSLAACNFARRPEREVPPSSLRRADSFLCGPKLGADSVPKRGCKRVRSEQPLPSFVAVSSPRGRPTFASHSSTSRVQPVIGCGPRFDSGTEAIPARKTAGFLFPDNKVLGKRLEPASAKADCASVRAPQPDSSGSVGEPVRCLVPPGAGTVDVGCLDLISPSLTMKALASGPVSRFNHGALNAVRHCQGGIGWSGVQSHERIPIRQALPTGSIPATAPIFTGRNDFTLTRRVAPVYSPQRTRPAGVHFPPTPSSKPGTPGFQRWFVSHDPAGRSRPQVPLRTTTARPTGFGYAHRPLRYHNPTPGKQNNPEGNATGKLSAG